MFSGFVGRPMPMSKYAHSPTYFQCFSNSGH